MYETGPWQMSFSWVGSYNNNGNGSVGCSTIAVNAATCTTPAATGVPGRNSTAFGPGNNPANLSFGQESVQKWELGVNYALGPGIKLTGGGLLYTASGPSAAVSGNSWGLLMGMDLRF